MADEKEDQTFLQKLLFYTTAFFILLGTFSLFAFLFLVPFVIDPAFTTIFMQFETRPAECVTIDVESRRGDGFIRSTSFYLSSIFHLCHSLFLLFFFIIIYDLQYLILYSWYPTVFKLRITSRFTIIRREKERNKEKNWEKLYAR